MSHRSLELKQGLKMPPSWQKWPLPSLRSRQMPAEARGTGPAQPIQLRLFTPLLIWLAGRPEPPPGECYGCSGVCPHQGKAAGRPGSEGRGAPPPLCPYPQSSATLPALCLKAPASRPALTPGGVVCGNT